MAAPAPAIQNALPLDSTSNPTTNTGGARASLTALRQAAQQISSNDLASIERLALLEPLRTQALQLLSQQRLNYIGQPLPLAEDERSAWEEQVALWHAFYFGFALCADITEPDRAAMVWARALDSLGRAIREHGRVYRAVPPALWKELNSCYRTAEACEVHATPVTAGDIPGTMHTCKQVYLATLLHDAANLAALSGGQMRVVERWLARWVDHADLLADAPAEAARSPLAIRLDGETGARHSQNLPKDEYLRYLDTSALGPHLRGLAAALREQRHHADLAPALADLPRSDVERLLTHLYVQWCSAGTGRHEDRDESSVRAQVATNLNAVHFQISGRAFRQPGMRYTRDEEHDLATFGHITERTEQRLLTGRSATLEPWEIVNRGAGGSLGMRRKPDLQSRIAHGQLIAVRTSSAMTAMLGVIQRLRTESDGGMNAGMRLIANEARGVAVRIPSSPTPGFERALLLAADNARKVPESVIVPAGSFLPGTILELHDKRTEKVQLGEVLERGFDFERLTCERL
jgi:hypothetical protein